MGRTLFRSLLIGVFIGLGVGAIIGLTLSRFVDLPAVEVLTTFRPISATQVRAKDGTLLGTFAAERRIPLAADQIPQVLRDAVIAVEDANFYQHTGVDPRGILRAAIMNVFNRRWSQGASTITQQLTRSVGILSREKKLVRKVKEMLLAIEIEQRLSKDQIFTLYANQVNFGHGNYGVEAASRFFYGKPASRLTLPEAALLAGLPQQPSRLSPIDFPARALARRNHVLDRMLEEKKIDRAAHDAAMKAPLGAAAHYDRVPASAYFVEEVRRAVEEQFGTRQMLEGGLTIETTLDFQLQNAAEESVREGLVALQHRQGWPGARRNVLADGEQDLDLLARRQLAVPALEGRRAGLRPGHQGRGRTGGPAHRRPRRQAGPRRGQVDRPHQHDPAHQARRRGVGEARGERRPVRRPPGDPRARAADRGGAAHPRQPERGGPGPGRRLRLRPLGVRPRVAVLTPVRLRFQAFRLPGRLRARLLAGRHDLRRAVPAPRREGRAHLLPAQLLQALRRHRHAAPRPRALAQRLGGQAPADGRRRSRHRCGQAPGRHRETGAVPDHGARLLRALRPGAGRGLRRHRQPRPGPDPYFISGVKDAEGKVIFEAKPRSSRPSGRTSPTSDPRDGGRGAARHRGQGPASSAPTWPARPAPRTATPTPGSSAPTRASPARCGSAAT